MKANLPTNGWLHNVLVSTAQLAQHLNDPDWRIIDCRHNLADVGAGRCAYGQAHIPGAHFFHLDDDLSGAKSGRNGRHPLPDANTLAGRFAECKIIQYNQIVIYDDAGGMIAARLWWLLRWLGYEKVSLLDGGITKWLAENRVTDANISQPIANASSKKITAKINSGFAVDAKYVEQHLHQPDMRLIDARAPDRFAGQNETLDPVAGHIPGAMNRFFKTNLDAVGCFRQAEELAREFKTLLAGKKPEQVVHQCGSGITACHNVFAMELAGLHGSKLYPGSWSEWCADASRPVEK